MLMLDAFYKGYNVSPLFVKDEILKMVAWEETQGMGLSIDANQMKQLMHFYSGEKTPVKIIEDPTIEQIKQLLVEKKPVLVLADGKVLPNPHFRNGDRSTIH